VWTARGLSCVWCVTFQFVATSRPAALGWRHAPARAESGVGPRVRGPSALSHLSCRSFNLAHDVSCICTLHALPWYPHVTGRPLASVDRMMRGCVVLSVGGRLLGCPFHPPPKVPLWWRPEYRPAYRPHDPQTDMHASRDGVCVSLGPAPQAASACRECGVC
jgi:hypothetical protein